MKKVLLMLLVLPVLISGCATNRQIADNNSALKEHQPPFKVFGIGYWVPGYSILTLTDSGHDYFTIKAVRNDSLKVGDMYRPQL